MVNLKEIILEKSKIFKKDHLLPNAENYILGIEEIDVFKTWFNPNCAIVINKLIGNETLGSYATRLVIYEPTEKKMEEIYKVIKINNHWSLDEAKKKAEKIKKTLNGDNPIYVSSNFYDLYKLPNPSNIFKDKEDKEIIIGDRDKLISMSVVQKALKIDGNFSPEEHLKSLDIVWVKRWHKYLKIVPYYHVGIYLGNNQMVNIAVYREKKEGREKKLKKSRISSWEEFLKEDKEIVIQHAIIPFKRSELIHQQINEVIKAEYQKNNYNLLLRNCEHLSNTLVYGIDTSNQVVEAFDKAFITLKVATTVLSGEIDYLTGTSGRSINLKKEIRETNKMLENLKLANDTEKTEEENYQALIEVSPSGLNK